jgi:hypothetical protein
VRRTRLLENEIRVLKDESTRLGLEQQGNKEKVKDNLDKIKLNRQLPYLVGNVVEVLDQVPEVRTPLLRRSLASAWPTLSDGRGARQTRLAREPPARVRRARGAQFKLADGACAARSLRRRRTAATWTWTRSAQARLLCSRRPRGKPSSCPSWAWWTPTRSSRATWWA